MLRIKITEGYVSQTFDEQGKCIGQQFNAGNESTWETEDGESLKPVPQNLYFPFDMEQPE